jgi:RNA polymerase primary sigma factor
MRALIITNTITRRDEKSLEKYLNEISRFGVLSPEEELALFEIYRAGDEEALHDIMKHNLRFVVSVAKQYQHAGLWLGDLINEGNLGLIKAAQRFDETKGFKFISYAVWWIRQSIILAINKKGRKIRIPQNQTTAHSKIKDAALEFLQQNEREPSVEELAEKTGYASNLVEKCLLMHKNCRSLDEPLEEGEGYSLQFFIEDKSIEKPDFEIVEQHSKREEVKQMLRKLTDKEAAVLRMYYGIGQKLPMTLNDISNYLGLSRERVRQVKDRSLKKLRKNYKEEVYSY